MKKILLLSLLTTLIIGLTSCVTVSTEMYDMPEKYPSEHRPWPSEDDDVLIYAKFNSDINSEEFNKLVVMPINQENVSFDSLDSDVDEDERDEDADEVAKQYLEVIDTLYWAEMQNLQEYISQPISWDDKTGAEGELVLEIDVTVVNPGSQAARYFASFGAGATELRMNGRIIDSASDDVLVEFIAEDRGLGGSFGGDSYELLEENMTEIVIARIGSLIYSSLGN